jgi:hypothetical protein
MRAGTRREYASLVDERGRHAGAAAATFQPPKPGRAPWSGLDIAAVILMVLVLALIVGVIFANLGETAF